jgi:hypothetical protein
MGGNVFLIVENIGPWVVIWELHSTKTVT